LCDFTLKKMKRIAATNRIAPLSKYIVTAYAVMAMSAVISCKGSNVSPLYEESIAQSDSLNFSVIEEDASKSVNPPVKEDVKFKNVDELVNWLRNSESWHRYRSGIIPAIAKVDLKYASKLVNNHTLTFLIVDKATMKVYLYDKYGNLMKNYGIACARNYGTKHSKGDSRTPEGCFEASGIYDSTDWLYTDDEGVTSDVKGVYGPRFIRLRIPGIYSIGLHGTNAPWSIGGRRSHGCIRLHNDDITDLVSYVEKGTPIIVSPGPKDIDVNKEEGYFIPAVPLTPTSLPARSYQKEKPINSSSENSYPKASDKEEEKTRRQLMQEASENEMREIPGQEIEEIPAKHYPELIE